MVRDKGSREPLTIAVDMVAGGGAGTAEFDELKGRAKEAAGDLTGDEDLKREGKIDQGRREGEGSRRAGKRQDQEGLASGLTAFPRREVHPRPTPPNANTREVSATAWSLT